MPSYCYVHEPREASKSLFGIPKNAEIKILWEEALGMQLKKSHRICAKHFYESDFISTWDSGQGSSKYTVCLKRLQLMRMRQYSYTKNQEAKKLNKTKKKISKLVSS